MQNFGLATSKPAKLKYQYPINPYYAVIMLSQFLKYSNGLLP